MGRRTGASLTGRQMPEDMVQALAVEPKPCWAVTDGERGVWYLGAGQVRHLSSLAVTACDTTGCGDVFHGADAAAIAGGAAVDRALLSNAAAGLKAARGSGRLGVPYRAEVEQPSGHRSRIDSEVRYASTGGARRWHNDYQGRCP